MFARESLQAISVMFPSMHTNRLGPDRVARLFSMLLSEKNASRRSFHEANKSLESLECVSLLPAQAVWTAA